MLIFLQVYEGGDTFGEPIGRIVVGETPSPVLSQNSGTVTIMCKTNETLNEVQIRVNPGTNYRPPLLINWKKYTKIKFLVDNSVDCGSTEINNFLL